MKKILLLVTATAIFWFESISQSKKSEAADTVGSEYIPVEGHSETGVPKELQGTWILVSGIKNTKPAANTQNKKRVADTDTRLDSVTTTTTVNGETTTTTEVNIEKMAAPEKQITPAQKDKMHTAEKPSISFYGLNETFSGFTGCNKYSGRYSINGNKITLRDAAASTKMVCMGEYDEKAFLSALKKVNTFRGDNGKLELMDGSDVVLIFERK